jgi:hypothetical protein
MESFLEGCTCACTCHETGSDPQQIEQKHLVGFDRSNANMQCSACAANPDYTAAKSSGSITHVSLQASVMSDINSSWLAMCTQCLCCGYNQYAMA